MAASTNQVEDIKRHLGSYGCPCSRGEPDKCPLPLMLKDCACWYDRQDQCKALFNGRYIITNGVRCPRYDGGEDAVFDANHPHRLNELQVWARSNRDNPLAVLPKNLEHLLERTNGKKDLFLPTEYGHDTRRRTTTAAKKRYVDPRSGFNYGRWPIVHNGVSIRDPAECAIKRTNLEEVQKELDQAELAEEQQVQYYQAALEAQNCLPPSFNYPDIFKSESTAPRNKTSRKRPAEDDDAGEQSLSAHRSAKRNQPLAPENPHPWESSAQEESRTNQSREDVSSSPASRDGFPFHGNDNLVVPHPADFYNVGGVQNLTAVRHYGFGRLGQMKGLERAGLSDDQVRNYLQAADEVKEGWGPSFDYSTILGGKPDPVLETREKVAEPVQETVRQTRAVKRRLGALRNQEDEEERPEAKRIRVAEPEAGEESQDQEAQGGRQSGRSSMRIKALVQGKRDFTAAAPITNPATSAPSAALIVKKPAAIMGASQEGQEEEGSDLRRSARVKSQTTASGSGPALQIAPVRSNRRARLQATATQAAGNASASNSAGTTTAAAVTAQGAVPSGGAAPSGGFVAAMANGFNRTVWPNRPGIGRYPAYITKKGVKHMNDACKYIDNGRLLGRQCAMNNRLGQPYPARDLFIAKEGKRCSYCASRNFGPKQCDPNFAGKARKENRHN